MMKMSPAGLAALKRLLLAREAELAVATATVEAQRARASDDQVLIAHLKLQILKLQRERFGVRSERSQRLLDQLELQLEDLEASATEDELAAEKAASDAARAATGTTQVAAFTRTC